VRVTVLERINVEDAKKYAGRWVAVKSGKVIFAANTPIEVQAWIKARNESADVLRVLAEGESANWVF
jgi:hypothetical protein